MVKRQGRYYLMWSEGNWTNETYTADYGVADNPYGPFTFWGKILENNSAVATGAGHHSVLRLPGTQDEWVICYHRRPLNDTEPSHRVTCLDRLEFRPDGSIAPVILTHEGVPARG